MKKAWPLWVLGALLCSCNPIAEHNDNRAQQLKHDNALYYRRKCIEALERSRAVDERQLLPAALNGQSCQSALLGDYALDPSMADTINSSRITLDPQRLSDYTLQIEGLNGQTYDYVDRGDAEAEAEQEGTWTETAPDVVTPAENGDAETPTVDEATP